jgi:hypothetical protein
MMAIYRRSSPAAAAVMRWQSRILTGPSPGDSKGNRPSRIRMDGAKRLGGSNACMPGSNR